MKAARRGPGTVERGLLPETCDVCKRDASDLTDTRS